MQGLRLYLNTHKYGNAETEDLWSALGEVSRLPVPTIMNSWVNQAVRNPPSLYRSSCFFFLLTLIQTGLSLHHSHCHHWRLRRSAAALLLGDSCLSSVRFPSFISPPPADYSAYGTAPNNCGTCHYSSNTKAKTLRTIILSTLCASLFIIFIIIILLPNARYVTLL